MNARSGRRHPDSAPDVVFTSGFDSIAEDAFFAVAALRRGYNFLAYDGPGWVPRSASSTCSSVPLAGGHHPRRTDPGSAALAGLLA
ncbi:hypothetical protein [Nonomuraea africana]|uniref:Uncharacterized protein n=1 Tax=Nonomuraea africana TaxID=46171 RepID=A0ABR9KJ29_9ACTN|nr:hypothetical protein [Nonomuraea africana]MBE1562019.1 hypothetical protein [Nonomuraea africana]